MKQHLKTWLEGMRLMNQRVAAERMNSSDAVGFQEAARWFQTTPIDPDGKEEEKDRETWARIRRNWSKRNGSSTGTSHGA